MCVAASWFNLCPPCGGGVNDGAGDLTVDGWLSRGISSVTGPGAMVEGRGPTGTVEALRIQRRTVKGDSRRPLR